MTSYLIVLIYLFVLGCCFGSFLNVVIYRLPLHKSLVTGRSSCTSCGTQIKAYDLVPVLSYLFLRGKCRNCKAHISIRYVLVEVTMGLLCVGTVWMKGFTFLSACWCIYGAILIVISLIDWDTMLIPDPLNVAILIGAIPICLLANDLTILERLIGFFIISIPLFLFTLVINGAFGGGDIKFMAVSGLLLGPYNIAVAFFIAVLFGGFYAIYLLFIRKVGRKGHMPFGPFLCFGCYMSLLFGEAIIKWYIQFLII
ncbi:MAG: prepilin peptidase [Eubacteriales bacterium]